ncbi:MAG: tetratricopeptide repeat protein [Promethearchaeota archaeon]|nr:MAG: tetratricopeptide repeat protein [Candidatus Lokiarchaeota archaeon]
MSARIETEKPEKKENPFFKVLNKANKKKLKELSLWVNLGLAYNRSGMFDKSIEVFKYLMQVDPSNIIILNELGLNYFNIGEYEKAIETFKKVIKLSPNCKQAWINLRKSYIRMGDYFKASKANKHARIIDLNLFNDWNQLGISFRQNKNGDMFNSFSNASMNVNFISAKKLRRVAEGCLRDQRFLKAIKFLKRSLLLNSEDKKTWNKLGEAYMKVYYYEKAKNAFKHSLKLDPKYEQSWNNLSLVYSLKKGSNH